MQKNRLIMCLLSSTLLFNTFNINTKINPFQIAGQPIEKVDLDNINEMVENNLGLIKHPIVVQFEKDKLELENKKTKELRIQQEEEIKRIEEQKNRDLYLYYNPYDLREISGISVDKVYELLKGTTYQTWDDAQAFINAEKLKPSVNVLFLIGLCNFESYYGHSGLARDNNNIVSWRLTSGWRSFASKTECIDKTAKMLSNEYLNPKGEFYNGIDLWSVNKLYCEELIWSEKVNTMVYELHKK